MLQIHDELLFEAADGEMAALRALVAEEMVAAYPLDPPLAVDVGWARPGWRRNDLDADRRRAQRAARAPRRGARHVPVDRAGERDEQMAAELFLPAVAADSSTAALGVAVGTVRAMDSESDR